MVPAIDHEALDVPYPPVRCVHLVVSLDGDLVERQGVDGDWEGRVGAEVGSQQRLLGVIAVEALAAW